jgi:hypothetical protein
MGFIDFVLLHSCITLEYNHVMKIFIVMKRVFFAASWLCDLAIFSSPHLLLDADSM